MAGTCGRAAGRGSLLASADCSSNLPELPTWSISCPAPLITRPPLGARVHYHTGHADEGPVRRARTGAAREEFGPPVRAAGAAARLRW